MNTETDSGGKRIPEAKFCILVQFSTVAWLGSTVAEWCVCKLGESKIKSCIYTNVTQSYIEIPSFKNQISASLQGNLQTIT